MPFHTDRKSGQSKSKRVILAMRYGNLSVANCRLMILFAVPAT
jgi:hypothetical protein